jgi:hypothetical protein
MLELRLRSGQVVAFDGRVVEVFAERGPSDRFHLDQLDAIEAVEGADGSNTVVLEEGVTLAFAYEEAPACARLVAALAQAREALERPVSGSARVG